MKKPVVLAILDGLGESLNPFGNAVLGAKTPNIDRFRNTYPNTQLVADGLRVGLPYGQMGNSEVGHTNIGAGRVVFQSLTQIDKAIVDGEFQKNKILLNAISNPNSNNLHIIGLLSDGGVHASEAHIFTMIRMAAATKSKNIFVHVITDGRDVDPKSAIKYLKELDVVLMETGAKLATISGRYYAMDRDKR